MLVVTITIRHSPPSLLHVPTHLIPSLLNTLLTAPKNRSRSAVYSLTLMFMWPYIIDIVKVKNQLYATKYAVLLPQHVSGTRSTSAFRWPYLESCLGSVALGSLEWHTLLHLVRFFTFTTLWLFRNMIHFYGEKLLAGGPPLVSSLWLLIQYICSYLPCCRPFLHLQLYGAPRRGDRDPLI
jgi:hypothetical protein